MRRQYFWWTFLVGAIVCFVYGGYTLIYHFQHGKGLSVYSLILFILGSLALVTYIVLYVISLRQKKIESTKKVEEKEEIKEQPVIEVKVEEEKEPEPIIASKPDSVPAQTTSRVEQKEYREPRKPSSSYVTRDIYVSQLGYGPVLRVYGEQIVDMRNNTYYRLQGNTVHKEGRGPIFEISGNRIRSAFGSYLYEISGDNINKVFGGFFASISGNTITKYDSSVIYQMSGSLNTRQILAIVALLFGEY